MAKEHKGNGKFVVGTLIGAAIGAVAALLTAPKSGRETRKDLKDKATEMSHEAVRQLRKLEGELNREVEALIARGERMKDQAIKMAEDIKNDAKKQLDEKFMQDMRRVIADLERLKDDAQDVAKKVKK